MSNLTSVNRLSLEKTRNSLCAYLAKNINLPSLVNRLGALKHELVNFDEDWLALYEEQRFALEEINALALDEGKTQPLREHAEIALRIITSIKDLINVKLE